MKHQFDELTKGLAKPVTRRQAFKRIGGGLGGLALARLGLNDAQAIINGELDGDAHPNVGGVVWRVSPRPEVPPPLVAGSGLLIDPRVFLTAGHGTALVEGMIAQGIMTLDDLLVSFASNASNPDTWLPISALLTHPAYVNNATSSEDVGVLILREPFIDVAPIQLPPLGFLNDLATAGKLKSKSDRTWFTVVGYGVDPGDANNGHLPFPPDGLRRIARPEFRNLHDRWLYTDQNDSHENGGSCTGDSGGPLFWTSPDTLQETLVAIVSRGTITSASDYRVDTEPALTFLYDVIARVNAGDL